MVKLKDLLNEKRVKRGSRITYIRQFAFGKKGKETASVMAIRGNDVLLDNGEQLDLRDIRFNKKKYKVESVSESDLPTTTKKDKTVTVVHKTSGKELVVTDTSSTRKKYKRMGYFVQADPRKIKWALMIAKKMSGDMTGAVKKIERIEKDLSNNHDVANALKAANESINEAGMFDDYHQLNPAYMDRFIKNYKKLNSKNIVKKSGGDVYGFRKGKKEAHWKFDDDYKLYYDIDKAKALGLINFFNRAKKDHPWG